MKELSGFFHDDPKLPKAALDSIDILARSESMRLWDRFISLQERHFMLLPNDAWPSRVVRDAVSSRDFGDDWEHNAPAPFGAWLRSHVEANDDDEVLIFYMREHCIRSSWGTLCEHWINFLYEDEGVCLVLPNRSQAFVLSNGNAWAGERSKVSGR